jgi:siroheme synthase (precorrin-2 oxidase/ferrochelatase)
MRMRIDQEISQSIGDEVRWEGEGDEMRRRERRRRGGEEERRREVEDGCEDRED